MRVELSSPESTLVLLLGASKWPYLPDLQQSAAFTNTAREFREYLLDPSKFNLPFENLLDLFDSERNAHDQDQMMGDFLDRRIRSLAKSGQGVKDVLVYYVGHGGFTYNDSFFLAIRSTRVKHEINSGILIASLANTLREHSRFQRHLLILDCCFAAEAVRYFQGADLAQVVEQKVKDAFEVPEVGRGVPDRGTSLLCSSSRRVTSRVAPNEQYTIFGEALMWALSRGDAHLQGKLSLSSVQRLTEEYLQRNNRDEDGAPRPEVHSPDQSRGDVALVPFFPNPAASTVIDSPLPDSPDHRLPSTPHPSPRRGRSVGLWIELILLLTTITLGIWGIVTKPDIIISLIAFGLVVFAVLLGIVQVAPRSFVQMQQSIKMGLFVTGIVLLLGSLALNLVVLIPAQSRSGPGPNTSSTTGPNSTQTTTLTSTPSLVPVTTGRIHEFPIQTGSSKTTGIARGPDGNLWFIEEQGNKIGRITPQGVITEFSIPTPNSISDGITRGPDGNLWFFENKGDKIGRITPQGKITEFPVHAGSDLVGLTAGPDGNLWFVGYQPNTIWRMTTSGVITGRFPIPTAGSGTETITAGPDGNVWFVEDWGDRVHPKIGRITPQGIFTEYTIPTPLVPGGQNYHDLITGPDGNLWFTEGLAHKIGRITRQGVITEFSVPPPSIYFGSLCVGADGNLWFTDSGNYIGRMTTSGVVTNFFLIPTTESHPAGLTAGPDKNIWFVEVSGNNVGQVRTGL